jgi:ferritin-like metal-binding protein YciE
MLLSTKRLREQFADAQQHLAETKAHVDRQRQIVKKLPIKEPRREEAVQMLAILDESLRVLEQHRELIRSWFERGE